MELVLLGTGGGPILNVPRAQPATAIVHGEDLFVIDCGNGVGRQLVDAELSCRDLRAIFLTHHHFDHNADLGNLLLFAWMSGLDHQIDVVGPEPLADALESFRNTMIPEVESREMFGMPAFADSYRAVEIGRPPSPEPVVVYSAGDMVVTCVEVVHPPMARALAFRFDADGKSVVISGDTAPCESLIALARGADVLVNEAYLPDRLAGALEDVRLGSDPASTERVVTFFARTHTSAADAGRVATDAGVGSLVLTHLIPGKDVADARWRGDAAAHFAGPIHVGHDLFKLQV